MNKKIIFLKDSEINDWLIQGFAQREFLIDFMGIKNSSRILSSSRIIRILNLHSRYLNLSFKALFQSKKDGIMICFLDVVGLYVFLLSRLLCKKRYIVPINIMFNDRKDFITTMKRLLFRSMLKSSSVYPTVNSEELSSIYRKIFNLPNKDFFVLHDCYGKLGKYKKHFSEGNNTVFCGGTNGRDWKTLIQIARLLPHVKFVIAGPAENTLGNNVPSNIKYYHNIPFLDFQHLIEESSVLALPLDTEAPAGLIVLFTAGLMSKAVVTTNNITMREYIQPGVNGLLVEMGNYENFAKQIDSLLSNKDKQREFGEKLCSHIEKLGAPLVYVDGVINIINFIIKHENPSNK